MNRISLLFVIMLACTVSLWSQSEQEISTQAAEAFEEGDYIKAFPLYSQLLSLNTQNAEYNYRFGACAMFAGKGTEKALKHLNYAVSLGAPAEAYYYQD